MLLLRPSPGVCVDRQVILRLKIDEAARKSVESGHFREEHQALQVYLEEHWFPSIKHNQRIEFDVYSRELSKVNRALWDLEDEIRLLRSLPQSGRERQTKRLVSIAFAIPDLNDDRARLVENINALFNVIAQEKLYSTTATTQRKNKRLRTKMRVKARG
jgi:hypothetical protein